MPCSPTLMVVRVVVSVAGLLCTLDQLYLVSFLSAASSNVVSKGIVNSLS